jgi:hypothetical protein
MVLIEQPRYAVFETNLKDGRRGVRARSSGEAAY